MFWGLSFGCPTGLTGQTCPTKKRLTFQKSGDKLPSVFLSVCGTSRLRVPAERPFLFQRSLIVTVVITGIVPTDQFQRFAIPDHDAITLL